jgi:fucose permease
MVGVVGSSPIAPTNILQNTKHPVATLGAFLYVGVQESMGNSGE